MKKSTQKSYPVWKGGKTFLGCTALFSSPVFFCLGMSLLPTIGAKVQNILIKDENTEEKENVFLFMNVYECSHLANSFVGAYRIRPENIHVD